jgi:HD-GYP domain-containing protein (c-di-GMP phosphodiesterase class II)
LSARIFAIVDVWDALTNDRPYRKAWDRQRTLEHIQSQSGTHFDPEVVGAFVDMMDEGGGLGLTEEADGQAGT